MKPNLVVLISGRGSNLKAIIDHIKSGALDANISAIISSCSGAKGLEHAGLVASDTHILKDADFLGRAAYDAALIKIIDQYAPTLVILAGYMRILSDEFVTHYTGRLLNIHPSLLPKYKGLHTHQRVLAAGDKVHGATAHFVSSKLDSGRIIMQTEVPVLKNDNEKTLAGRVLEQEHQLYTKAINKVLRSKLLN